MGDDIGSRVLVHQSHHLAKSTRDAGTTGLATNSPDSSQQDRPEAVPAFADSPPDAWSRLFTAKARIAAEPVATSTAPSDVVQAKTDALRELVAFVGELARLPPVFNVDAHAGEIIDVFTLNVFRDTGPPVNPLGITFDPEEDEPVLDADWIHLHLAYELLTRFLESGKFNSASDSVRACVDERFLARLFASFDSEDPRERDACKTVLHRLYGKMLPLRSSIRRHMQHTFQECIEEEELNASVPSRSLRSRHCIAELLEILGSIVNGFAVPLREEHRQFLLRTLLPLHKCHSLALFHAQLSYVCVQFVEKEPPLLEPVIRSLLRMWPKTHSGKQILFLSELEQLLDGCDPQTFATVAPYVSEHLAKALSSAHFQVAERALSVLATNDFVGQLVLANADVMLPRLFPPLNAHCRPHWNRNVQAMSLTVLKSFMDNTPQLFERALQDALASTQDRSAGRAADPSGVRKKSVITSQSPFRQRR